MLINDNTATKSKIEKIKAKYELKKQIKITKDNGRTDYLKEVLKNKQKLIPEYGKIREMKRALNAPIIKNRIANLLIFLVIVMTVTSTCTSIAGGLNNYDNLFTKVTFISFISFSQFMILIISGLKPYLSSKKLIGYINICLLAQSALIFVSISYNYIFVYNPNMTTYWAIVSLILCALFDISILILTSIAIALKLNLEGKQENNSFMSRVLGIISSLINYKLTSIENKIHNNMTENNKNSISDIEQKRYINYVENNIKPDNSCPSYKEIAKNMGISEHKAREIHKTLIDKKITIVKNNKTFLNEKVETL